MEIERSASSHDKTTGASNRATLAILQMVETDYTISHEITEFVPNRTAITSTNAGTTKQKLHEREKGDLYYRRCSFYAKRPMARDTLLDVDEHMFCDIKV